MNRILLVLVSLGLAAVIGRDFRHQLFEPLPLKEVLVIEVPKGTSLKRLLNNWQARGILNSRRQVWYLSLYGRVTGQATAVKAGEYQLGPGMRAIDLTALVVSGRGILHELRLVEGWRFDEALRAVGAHPMLQQTAPPLTPQAVMQALGRPELHPEGRFYPDTYKFPRGTTDLAFLKRAFEQMNQVLSNEWQARAMDLPYGNAEEALIMASIVERETNLSPERTEIAGVFVRRLLKGMRLQTDPTVIYGLGSAFDGNLRRRDLLADTPYNTYTRKGLPPTPISLPGRAAIQAALHPAEGDSLYFVARGDGSHQFSATVAEHNAAVRKYQLRSRPSAKSQGLEPGRKKS